MAIGDKHGVLMDFDKGVPLEVATLDADGKLAEAQRPSAAEMGASNPNLLDNWLFTADSVIDQKMGYVVPPGTAYSVPGGAYVGALTEYKKLEYVSSDGWPVINIDGTLYVAAKGSPIRGYTGSIYTLDRWKSSANITGLVSDDGLLLKNHSTTSGSGVAFWQPIEKGRLPFGEEVTFSVLGYDGTLLSGTGTIPESMVSSATRFINLYSEDATRAIQAALSPSGICDFIIAATSAGTEWPVKAAKLEPGSVQTLARKDAAGNWQLIDPPPHPATELAKCQRYFRRTGSLSRTAPYVRIGQGIAVNTTSAQILLSNPVEFRVAPAIAYTGLWELYDGAITYPVTAIDVIGGAGTDTTLLSVTSSGLTVGKMYQLRAANDGTASIYLDANL